MDTKRKLEDRIEAGKILLRDAVVEDTKYKREVENLVLVFGPQEKAKQIAPDAFDRAQASDRRRRAVEARLSELEAELRKLQ